MKWLEIKTDRQFESKQTHRHSSKVTAKIANQNRILQVCFILEWQTDRQTDKSNKSLSTTKTFKNIILIWPNAIIIRESLQEEAEGEVWKDKIPIYCCLDEWSL